MKQQIKNGMIFGLVSGIMFFLVGIAYSAWNDIKNSGDLLTANDWNVLVSYTVPSNAVMAFYLSACPNGWSEANGLNGNPDLRGEFIRGLDSGRGVDTGRVLGSSQADETKSHTHGDGTLGGTTNSAGAHTHTYGYTEGTFDNGAGDLDWRIDTTDDAAQGNVSRNTSSAGTHSHTVTITGNTAATGGSETRPRNVALLYCIKQ